MLCIVCIHYKKKQDDASVHDDDDDDDYSTEKFLGGKVFHIATQRVLRVEAIKRHTYTQCSPEQNDD